MYPTPITPPRPAPRHCRPPGRRRVIAAVLTVGTLVTASSALAASYVYYDGSYAPSQEKWSAEEPLTYSHGRSNDGRTICVSALYTDMSQVEPVACSSTTVVRPYNGTTKRAFSRATTSNGVDGKGRAEW